MKGIGANDAHTASIWFGDYDQRQYQLQDQRSVQTRMTYFGTDLFVLILRLRRIFIQYVIYNIHKVDFITVIL